MATITTATVLDEVTARTAGEAWTINTGGKLTIATDTRWHAKAPASLTGSLSSVNCVDGECLIDATKTRWLAITGGSGSLVIGATISQGGVSGYFLGFWASLTAAPSLTIGATGFIKFRQVTGGTFAAGALTGVSATAAGPDVPGWIEVVLDQAATITVPRLGKWTTRGDWFDLAQTTGVVGQIVQAPTNGGGAGTMVPAVWIETAPGSNDFEIYTSLYTWTNGWSIKDLSGPASEQDHRLKYVSSLGSGQVQLGNNNTQTGTYANIASQASTYATVAHTGTYTWAGNVVSVYCSSGHFLRTGESTGLDFTTGSATDGVYAVTVKDAYNFEVTLAGSGTGGNVTSRAFIAITFTNHLNHIGYRLLCDFTSGSGVDGTYTVKAVNSANVAWVAHPHTVAMTAGNVTVYRGATLTFGAVHGLAIGNRADIVFTSGTGVSGIYTLETIPGTTTAFVNIPANMTSGNFTVNWQTGYVPPAGCRIRIPNIIGRQCVTTTRSVNAEPHATIASRPEFATTSAGYVDVENMLDDWWYNCTQPYYFKFKNSATFDQINLTECATAFVLDNFGIGMHAALDANTLILTSNFAGGYIGYGKAMRGNAPSTTDHAVTIAYCNNLVLDGLECAIVQYPRSTGKPININLCNDTVIDDLSVYNGHISITTCNRLTINKADVCDRITGYSNNTTAYYAVDLLSSNDITIANVSFGHGFTIPNQHSASGLVQYGGCNRVKIRSTGTRLAPIPRGTWAPNVYGFPRFTNSFGNNNTVKIQELYAEGAYADICATVNSDKNVLMENIHLQDPLIFSTRGIWTRVIANLNCTVKNFPGAQLLSGSASVYGTHWTNWFNQGGFGELAICCNEPTPESLGQVNVASGTAKWDSVGGVILPTIGTQVIWETPDWIRGTTFRNTTPLMTGGTIGNYALTYAIDTGSGYSAFKTLSAANLITEVIPASGFKLKVSIRTTTTNTTAITFLRIFTLNDPVVAAANPYPLDTNTVTFAGLPVGCDAVVLTAGGNTILDQRDALAGTSYTYTYSGAQTIDVGFIKPGYVPQYIRGLTLGTTDSSLPVSLSTDRNYLP
jgi:hypothetical protein